MKSYKKSQDEFTHPERISPIGIIHSPYNTVKEMPIQPPFSKENGEVEVLKEYEPGLRGLEGFSHIILIYLFHESEGYEPHVKPYLDETLRGIFATRAPWRPNPIGLSIVKLIERKGNILRVEGIDVLNETPLLDIKPFVPEFDIRENVRIGWLEGKIEK